MLFRAFITSLIISLVYVLATSYLIDGTNKTTLWYVLFVYWSLGFFSILVVTYGRKIKRNFRGETGTIKWFDPSKGYGFLIRDKGGDLFVHLRAVQPSDRRKLKENTKVRFSVENSEKGPQAENIRII
jgi:CspA family cold shock protein